uniref:Uncharacterized protein n=1 Tax=Ascaris lumbricoides TaxID=6252 RepID=A0A0M3IVI5_ASCLU
MKLSRLGYMQHPLMTSNCAACSRNRYRLIGVVDISEADIGNKSFITATAIISEDAFNERRPIQSSTKATSFPQQTLFLLPPINVVLPNAP